MPMLHFGDKQSMELTSLPFPAGLTLREDLSDGNFHAPWKKRLITQVILKTYTIPPLEKFP